MLKFSGAVIWRLGTRATIRKYSGPGATVLKSEKSDATRSVSDKHTAVPSLDNKDDSGLVAAAFAHLNSPDTDNKKKPSYKSAKQSKGQMLDIQIQRANDINGLLAVAENSIVSRRHALKMVSVLSEWSNSNKVKLSDFEKDPRFLKLCRILARSPATEAVSSLTMAEDLSTVLGITGDDEAARLIANLTLPQMVKVMKALQQKGRRSTPLLRALSHNISRQSEVLDLKKSADLLYSMASLNFPDPVLLDRICNDVVECLPSEGERASAASSVVVSLGVLRARHEAALAAAAAALRPARPAHHASALLTCATLGYLPPGAEYLLETAVNLKEEDMARPSSWLDLVFSLLILEKAEKRHLESTLRPEFIDKLLSSGEISIPARRKLALIESATVVQYGAAPVLAASVRAGLPVPASADKLAYVSAIMDTFRSIVSADAFLKRNCDSGMGFAYDAEFAVDEKCHPVPLEKAANDKSKFRIAVLGMDYHDMSRLVVAPLGIYHLYTRLLTLKGFKVLQIPYTEFNPKDKLVTRVQYINSRLAELVKDKPAS